MEKLHDIGEITYEHLFVDGTKIEANANKYSFVRMNRSIQSEGAFGVAKQNYGFRQFLLRGNRKVTTEVLILAMASCVFEAKDIYLFLFSYDIILFKSTDPAELCSQSRRFWDEEKQ